MRRPRTAGVVVIAGCAALAGCLGDAPKVRTTLFDRRPAAPADAGFVLNTRLVEQSAGDPYLNGGLWGPTTPPTGHERTVLLARNGLRVGVLAGAMPAEFERLAYSDGSTVSPMARTIAPGATKVVPVNGPLDRCGYRALADLAADPTAVELAAAECGVAVTTGPADHGRVRLTCEFRVQHGDKQAWLKESADGTEFTRQDRKAVEAYPALAFDVTLGPDDHLLIGATDDPAGTLGQAFFFTPGDERVRQRVLVIRAGK